MASIIIHGHFYQPPRENPWTGALDREPSARPYHDWNQRIHAECYRPNAFARVINGDGKVERIVNNYANISFNFGPTLMSWLEANNSDTYARIIDADRHSVIRYHGHGSAIAQAYNHAILPLCNERDRRTQLRWGLADFRHRFGREPQACWLPETACNDPTMAALIDEGMKFVILSPHQAERVRAIGGEWHNVGDGSVDPRRVYRYLHRDGSGRSIAVFFYDDGLARAVAFENLLWSSEAFVERLLRAVGDAGLVNVATDGESYGHHYRYGERCLAYALELEAPRRGLSVTNYAAFLEANPPVDEIEIKAGPNGEGTSWSCAHGVGRWYRNCGCHTGGEAGWTQEWRGPLRSAFDLLRDICADRFEELGGELFRDPWAARDEYIDVLLSRGAARERFIARHQRLPLDDGERIKALNLLEMQRASMLMYTSCGWFFTELSGVETVQTMKYAARAMDLMGDLGMNAPLSPFLEVLSQGRSNIAEMGNGADIYRRFIPGCRVHARRIAAHLAISSLANRTEREGQIGDFCFGEENFRQQKHGRLTLATCHIALTNPVVGERHEFAAAALHLGGVDFYCALRRFSEPGEFRHAAEKVWSKFRMASLPAMIRLVQEEFGPDEFGLEDVLDDGRAAICEMIFGDVFEGLTDQFARLYEEYNRVMEMLQELGFEPPQQVRQLTEMTLSRRFEREILSQQSSRNPTAYRKAIDLARVVGRHGYQIDRTIANDSFAAMINDAVRVAVERPSRAVIKAALDLIALSRSLGLEPNLDIAQEYVYSALVRRPPNMSQLTRIAVALRLDSSLAHPKSGHGRKRGSRGRAVGANPQAGGNGPQRGSGSRSNVTVSDSDAGK